MSTLLVTKDNLGVVLLLLLIVFLSQSKLLSFFAETKLGRGFLIIFIIFITFCNKSLGIISVLLIIIVFTYLSSGGLLKMEGFKTNPSKTPTTTTISSSSKDDEPIKTKAKEGFDIYGLEDVIKRGKLSNALPCYKEERRIDIDELSPFNELYTSMFSPI
jgi:hypothetical protein